MGMSISGGVLFFHSFAKCHENTSIAAHGSAVVPDGRKYQYTSMLSKSYVHLQA
jgi:hypothetical protein